MRLPVSALLRALCILCTLCLLPGGCALLSPEEEGGVAAVAPAAPVAFIARPARGSIETFAIAGRVAIRQEERTHVSGVVWEHAMERDEMRLTAPLGQTVAELVRDHAGARLLLSDGRETSAADLEGLANDVFGIDLPLTAMPFWILADTPARARQIVLDEAGRPLQLELDDWQIRYETYESPDVNALPTFIRLHREAAEGREPIDVRLKIDTWTLPE